MMSGRLPVDGLSPSGIRASAVSHPGVQRDQNEDAYALLPGCDLYLVSDGVGGQPHGEVASRIVVDALPGLLCDRLADRASAETELPVLCRDSLRRLSRRVRDEAGRRPGWAGMGATVVLVAVRDGWATVAHMGDSRAYLFRSGGLLRLTTDHSVVGILVERGEITEVEGRHHPARGRITRFVGMGDAVDPDVTSVELQPQDRLLLCSDGLTGVVEDAELAAVLAATAGDCEAACQRLLDAALAAGAPDNVTVLVADRVGDDPPDADGTDQ